MPVGIADQFRCVVKPRLSHQTQLVTADGLQAACQRFSDVVDALTPEVCSWPGVRVFFDTDFGLVMFVFSFSSLIHAAYRNGRPIRRRYAPSRLLANVWLLFRKRIFILET